MPGDSGHEQTLLLLWYKSLVALQLYFFYLFDWQTSRMGVGSGGWYRPTAMLEWWAEKGNEVIVVVSDAP